MSRSHGHMYSRVKKTDSAERGHVPMRTTHTGLHYRETGREEGALCACVCLVLCNCECVSTSAICVDEK